MRFTQLIPTAYLVLLGAVLLSFSACGPTNNNKQDEEVDEIKLEAAKPDVEVYVFLEQLVEDKNVWHAQLQKEISANENMFEEKCFYNMLDSSQVYCLFRAKKASEVEEWCNSLNQFGAATTYSSIILQSPDTLNLNFGLGETYLRISHRVKDVDVWYNYFSMMNQSKEEKGIYPLGVFTGTAKPDKVHVLARSESLEAASEYGGDLEGSDLIKEAGVLTTDALVLRAIDYK